MKNENILSEFIEQVWNKKDFSVIEKYVDSEYTIHLDTADPWEGKTLNHKEFKERLKYTFNSFPDIHFSIQETISDENHIAISWIMSGTNLGMLGEIPATGKAIRTSGITIYYFKNNKINGHCQVFDRMTVFQQLGF